MALSRVELVEARDLDYAAYAAFQREAYAQLLARSRVSDAFMTAQFYAWKYLPPAGPARIGLIRDDKGICSSIAIVPYGLEDSSGRLSAWQTVDGATRPGARRQGFSRRCLEELVKSLGDEEAMFAFPNASSLPIFLHVGCRENGVMTTWVSPFAWLTRRRCEDIGRVGELTADRAWKADGVMVAKGADYLTWRYLRHPCVDYTIFACPRGLAVVRQARVLGANVCLIMELLGSDPVIRGRLLRYVAAWSVDRGCALMVMLNTSIPTLAGLAAGFCPIPSFLLPKRQVQVVYTRAPEIERAVMQRWKLQTGDWDVF